MPEETWNAEKKQLWKLSIKELQKRLQELQTDLFNQETTIRHGGGQRMINTKEYHVNIKRDRHRIACIKTILNVKLKNERKL